MCLLKKSLVGTSWKVGDQIVLACLETGEETKKIVSVKYEGDESYLVAYDS